jgi:hypothetical protein
LSIKQIAAAERLRITPRALEFSPDDMDRFWHVVTGCFALDPPNMLVDWQFNPSRVDNFLSVLRREIRRQEYEHVYEYEYDLELENAAPI